MADSKKFVKDYKEQIEKIAEHLNGIKEIRKELPDDASWAKSIDTSIVNFEKKISAFLATGTELTEEQKRAIAAIKAGNISKEEISALSARAPKSNKKSSSTSTGSNDEKTTTSPDVSKSARRGRNK